MDISVLSAIVTILVLSASVSVVLADFNVLNYGAVGDGKADDSQAFVKAWAATCGSTDGSVTMVVPKGKTFLVYPNMFNGPCKPSSITVTIAGTIMAPDTTDKWRGIDASLWLGFNKVNGVTINGYGYFNGRGLNWWNQSCKLSGGKPGCTSLAPTALKFLGCQDIHIDSVKFQDSPQTHILLLGCQRVNITNVHIKSPESSPNTDGIHIHDSQHISIDQSAIESGDDCISIGDLTSDIYITRIVCGPGHGISVGSLGYGGADASVERITVKYANFYGTTNGARIKTWQGAGGFVRDITFEHLKFTNVQNPIIIDQFYCNRANMSSCTSQSKGVHISGISYRDLTGTSATPVAINLNCSSTVSCDGLTFDTIQISSASKGQKVTATCNHASGKTDGTIDPPLSCLSRA